MAEISTRPSNPFGKQSAAVAVQDHGAMADVEQQRSIAEVQASMAIAKKCPRDQKAAMDRILNACTRTTLATSALYTYSRGKNPDGTDNVVSGPSIRLAEVAAQGWGNLKFGFSELSQRPGMSTVKTFAWDLETNVEESIIFEVPHWRHTKNGGYPLKDPRDIYELIANQAGRRLRKCIISIIPGDVIEAAVQQCRNTLTSSADTSPEAIKKMADKFIEVGVTTSMLEKRLGLRLAAIRPAQIVQLRGIYTSIAEGDTGPEDWFRVDGEPAAKIAVAAADLDSVPDAGPPETASVANGKATAGKVTAKAAVDVDSVPDAVTAPTASMADLDDIPDVSAPPAGMTAEAKAIQVLGNAKSADALGEVMAGLDEAVARMPLVLKTYDARMASFVDGVPA